MILNSHYYPDWIWKNTGTPEAYCAIAVVEGNRFGGKSVGIGKYAIRDYLEHGYRACFVTRYKADMEDQKILPFEAFWKKAWRFGATDNIIPDIEEHELSFKGHYAYIDGKLFAYPASLSVSGKTKNADFDNVHTIIFDEYISEDNTELQEEFTAIFRLYDTIARGRDDALLTTRMVFISNCITKESTLKDKLGMTKVIRKDSKRIDRREEMGWIYEQVKNKAVSEKYDKSPIARALRNSDEGKQYLGYAQNNEFKDNEEFVQLKPPKGKYTYMCNVTYGGEVYGIKYYSSEKKFYFTDTDVNTGINPNYAITKEDHNKNTLLIINSDMREKLRQYKLHFSAGNMLFNNLKSKATFMDIYKYL